MQRFSKDGEKVVIGQDGMFKFNFGSMENVDCQLQELDEYYNSEKYKECEKHNKENYEKIKEQERERLLNERLQNCGADIQTEYALENVKKRTFSNFLRNTDEQKFVYDKVFNAKTRFIMLYGNYGAGKTHLAFSYAIRKLNESFSTDDYKENLKYLLSSEIPGEMDSFFFCTGKFIADKNYKYSRDFNNDFRDFVSNLISANNLIIVDEIGQGGDSEFTHYESDSLYSLVDSCIENDRQLILISNLEIKPLLNFLGQRTADRIFADCTSVEFKGKSFRTNR